MVLGVGTFSMVIMLFSFPRWWYVRYHFNGDSDSEENHNNDSVLQFALLAQKCGGVVACFNVLVYFMGSMYLVVESFRQLFALPPDSFTLPSWGNYWPHFA